MINIGMLISDRYEVLEKIGTGGMSDVYKAKDHKLNRLVAVKMLKQEFSENANFVSKFRVEAQAAAGLMHPNIVNVYDVGEEKGVNYIVMELVDGITLKKYIEKKARLSVRETISIAIQVSMGLEAAHKNHIIHRDIKPQNIIISKDGKVKVTDFGIAKAVTSNTITSNVMGSVHYTSPEQARGGYSDEKSDIYSLGISMFEMLTGRVPFNGETTVAIAIKHIQQAMPSPCDFVPEIPRSVEQIVLKCCEKSPDRRYRNMAELIADLKQSLLHPEDDFVKVIHPDEESSTRAISDKERMDIRKRGNAYQNHFPEDEKELYSDREFYEEELPEDEFDFRYEEEEPRNYRAASRPSGAADRRGGSYRKKSPRKTAAKAGRRDVSRYDGYSEEEDYRRKKSDTGIAILVVAAALLTALLIIIFAAKAMGFFSHGAATAASAQTASASSSASSAADGILIPDVSGKSKSEANKLLKDKNFTVNIQEVSNESVQPDYVISQQPEGGTKAPNGSAITISVSTGPDTEGKVKIPDLVYRGEREAVQQILDSDLVIGDITYKENVDSNLRGKVISQSVKEGSYVEPGTVVNLEVGKATYKYEAEITAPTVQEDPDYMPGTEVYVIIQDDNGRELMNQVLKTLPYPISYKGLETPYGMLQMAYTNTVNGEQQQKTITRELSFTQEK